MAQEQGPWNGRPRAGLALWLCFGAALAGLIWALVRAFPEAVTTRDDWGSVVYTAAFALVLTAGALRAGRRVRAQHLRYAIIWVGVVALLAMAFTYQDELKDAGRRLRVAVSGGEPVSLGGREIVVPQGMDGHYWLVGRVNGERVRFMVDTGATDTVLSPDDARRVGMDVNGLRYDREALTANGVGYGALVSADRFEVGPIALADFPLVVNQADMGSSLLGMSFLKQLDSFHFEHRELILRPREGV